MPGGVGSDDGQLAAVYCPADEPADPIQDDRIVSAGVLASRLHDAEPRLRALWRDRRGVEGVGSVRVAGVAQSQPDDARAGLGCEGWPRLDDRREVVFGRVWGAFRRGRDFRLDV